MSFTFNWAGVHVNPIQVKDRSQQVREDAGNWGKAVRGYQVSKANDEYAEMLNNFKPTDVQGINSEIGKLTMELQQLKQRNAEIKTQLGY